MKVIFLLLAGMLRVCNCPAAFDENSLRYFSPWDIVFKLKATFPSENTTKNHAAKKNACANLNLVASEFGASAPATGNAVSNSPSPLAIRWIEICTNEITKNYFSGKTAWNKNTPEEQNKILLQLFHQILGEDAVVYSYGYITNASAFVKHAQDNYAKETGLSTQEVERHWALALVLRDEYLSY